MKAIRHWLAETHGGDFELLRHFIVCFFDSDLVSSRGQWTPVLIGNLAMGLPIFLMIVPAMLRKYRYLSSLPSPGLYQQAVRADQLWLITLTMAIVGLLVALKLQSLFPDFRDYMTLGHLPLRPRQIYTAKLTALLLLAVALIFVLNLAPALMFPVISAGRWQRNPSLPLHILAHLVACAAGCFFCFFALVASQGVLLNILPQRAFSRFTVILQGLLLSLMLGAVVFSFSIGPPAEEALLASSIGRSLPPVWFLGLYRTILGDSEPVFTMLAGRAAIGLATALLIALGSYLLRYHRHRELLLERPSAGSISLRIPSMFEHLLPAPQKQAVILFITKTLLRSGPHRVLLTGYLGLAFALSLSGALGIGSLAGKDRAILSSFVYAHLISIVILLVGIRHMFALPAELPANWLFQLAERQGRPEWLQVVDYIVAIPAVLIVLVLPFPLEAALLGSRALAETVLMIFVFMALQQFLFRQWDKLPFTCSYAPGKTPPLILFSRGIGILAALPLTTALILQALDNRIVYGVELLVLFVSWLWLRSNRNLNQHEVRLRYEDGVEPVVRVLLLGR